MSGERSPVRNEGGTIPGRMLNGYGYTVRRLRRLPPGRFSFQANNPRITDVFSKPR
jgi:hypothetical protein